MAKRRKDEMAQISHHTITRWNLQIAALEIKHAGSELLVYIRSVDVVEAVAEQCLTTSYENQMLLVYAKRRNNATQQEEITPRKMTK